MRKKALNMGDKNPKKMPKKKKTDNKAAAAPVIQPEPELAKKPKTSV